MKKIFRRGRKGRKLEKGYASQWDKIAISKHLLLGWNIWKDNAQEFWKTKERHKPTDQRSSENNKQAYIHTQTQVHTPQPHTHRHNIVTAEKQNKF